MAAAFHLINDLILLSIFWSPLDFASASGDIVFIYGVVLDKTKSDPSLYECSINSFIKNCALCFPSFSKTAEIESNQSLVSSGSISLLLTTILTSSFNFFD